MSLQRHTMRAHQHGGRRNYFSDIGTHDERSFRTQSTSCAGVCPKLALDGGQSGIFDYRPESAKKGARVVLAIETTPLSFTVNSQNVGSLARSGIHCGSQVVEVVRELVGVHVHRGNG